MVVDGNNAIPRSAVKARKCDPQLQKWPSPAAKDIAHKY